MEWLLFVCFCIWLAVITVRGRRGVQRAHDAAGRDTRLWNERVDREQQAREDALAQMGEEAARRRTQGEVASAELRTIREAHPRCLEEIELQLRLERYAPDGISPASALGPPDYLVNRTGGRPVKLYTMDRIRHQERHDEDLRTWRQTRAKQLWQERQKRWRKWKVQQQAQAQVAPRRSD